MNLEAFIKEHRKKFNNAEMPQGHELRFAARLAAENRRNRVRKLWIAIPLAMAAAVFLVMFLSNLHLNLNYPSQEPVNERVVELRRVYDERMDDAIGRLEKVMENLDDSTKMELTKVIEDLSNTSQIFAEIAPLPEEKQLLIAWNMYDNQLNVINRICEDLSRINKIN